MSTNVSRWKWRLGPHKHDWFPDMGQGEFLGHGDICLSCDATRFIPPYGECLTRHPLADHYGPDGEEMPVVRCPQGPL